MPDKTCEVVIVGGSHTDLQLVTVGKDLFSRPSYSVNQMVLTTGGDTLNEATIISRLGHSVRLVSCIGKDRIGGVVIDHCAENGIDTTYLKQDPEKITSINVGLIFEDHERIFINNKSGCIWTTCPADIDLSAVRDAKVLCFASIFNNPLLDGKFMVDLFMKAKSEGMIICADIVTAKNGETLEDIKEGLSYIDYFFPNLDEAEALTGKKGVDEVADCLLGLGVKNVIINTGKKGCVVKNAGERIEVPGYPASKAIDSTGAGDNFASGFISGLLEGRNLRDCAVLANVTASIAVEYVGAVAGVTDRAVVDERYRAYQDIYGL